MDDISRLHDMQIIKWLLSYLPSDLKKFSALPTVDEFDLTF